MGVLEPQLKKHLTGCPVCEEAAAIQRWMNDFQAFDAAPVSRDKKLPTVETLWQGAFTTRQPAAELARRALRPLLIPRLLSFLTAVILPLFLVFFYWAEIAAFFSENAASSPLFGLLVSLFKNFSETFSFILLPMALCLLTMIVLVFVTGFQPRTSAGNS